MIRFFLAISSLFRPGDQVLSKGTKARVQLYRLMSLLGAFLITALSILYRTAYPEVVSPDWGYLGLSGLFLGLFGASYVSARVRKRYVPLMWALLYVQMVWITGLAVMNQFESQYALAVLLVYASIGVVIELGAQSLKPILWFLGSGFLLTAGALFLTPAPRSEPSVLLGIMAVTALTIGFSLRGRLSIRRKLTDREKQLEERRQKVESLYEATGRLLAASGREDLRKQVRRVLREVFGYSTTWVRFADEEEVLLEETPPGNQKSGMEDSLRPALKAVPSGEDVVGRAYQSGETVVAGGLEESVGLERGPLRSVAAVPIEDKGVLVIGHEGEGQGFDSFNMRLIEMLTTYAALATDRLDYEEELVRARDEAEKAARMKSAMLANMSHEIRTPLTSIIGFAESIGAEVEGIEPLSGSPIGTHAGLIEQSGKRLLDTLDGVLNLSKLEAGQMELTEGPVDLEAVAEQTVEEFRPKIQEEKVDVRLDTDSAKARADQGGVQIVLQNLVSNAIKYTDEGEVNVRTYRENGEVALEVEDTGIGMDPEGVESLFEPFRQASEGWGREYEGTGVGLAVTKKAAEQMGGSIEVETEKGEGSRFTVWLPRAES